MTDFTYNNQLQPLTITRPAAEPGGPRPTWEFTYDANGHVLTQQDALGNITTHEYDGSGRRIKTILSDPDGAAGPQTSPVWQWSYDLWSRVTQTVDPRGGVTDYDWYAWDTAPSGDEANAGKLHTVTLPEPELGAARPVTTFTWDRTGNLLTESDSLGRVTSWVRDDLDRVIQTVLPDPDGDGVGQPRPVYETVTTRSPIC